MATQNKAARVFRYGFYRPTEAVEREGLEAKCREIIETKGAHKRFNNDVKSRHVVEHFPYRNRYTTNVKPYPCRYCTEEARLLMGEHDIEDFVTYALEARLHATLDVLEGFIP